VSQVTVIRASRLIDGSGQPAIADGVVVSVDGVITAAGAAQDVNIPTGAGVLTHDYPGGTLLPGLIDCHTHLLFSASDTALDDAIHDTDETLLLRGLANAQAELRCGVTTLRDCGGRGFLTLALRDGIKRGLVVGPRILAAAMPITTTGGHLNFCGLEADGVHEVTKATRRLCKGGVDFIKVMATGGGMTPTSNIYEPQYTVAELRAIVREAARLQRRVTAHSHSPKGQRACLEAGIGMIEHCNWHTPAGQCFDEDLTRELNAAGVYIGITLSGPQQQAAIADQPFAELDGELRRRYEILRQMREMGSKIVLHSDAIAPITTYEAFPFSIIAAIRYGGFSLPEAIHACTARAAEAIGIDGITGTLAPGKAADLLIVEGNVEQDIRALSRTRQVLRSGRVVADHGAVYATPSGVPGSDGS